MNVLVAGSHGNTGQRIVDLLATDGHTVRAMIRDRQQADELRALGAEPVVADLEGDLSEAVEGVDAVIFAAGSGGHTGPEKTEDVDRHGAIRLIDAAEAAGARRFVMLSSMGTRDPESGPESMRHYFRAKRAADDHLRGTSLDWTIVRPGSLTDEDGTGMVEVAEHLDRRGEVSRDDVAAVIVTALRTPSTVGATFELLSGDELIGAALEAL